MKKQQQARAPRALRLVELEHVTGGVITITSGFTGGAVGAIAPSKGRSPDGEATDSGHESWIEVEP